MVLLLLVFSASIDHLSLLLLSLIVFACPYCAASEGGEPRTAPTRHPHSTICGGAVWVRGRQRRSGGQRVRSEREQEGPRASGRRRGLSPPAPAREGGAHKARTKGRSEGPLASFSPIHRVAWKDHSPKFVCRIPHSPGRIEPESSARDRLRRAGCIRVVTRCCGAGWICAFLHEKGQPG
jgi:hypothetical protein